MTDDQSRVRWSLKSPGRGWSYSQTQWLWRTAEDHGFHAVFHNDHLYGSTLESWTTLAAMFAQTTTIRGGTMVTSNSFRHPTMLAKMTTTVDIVSGGRLMVGLGTGNEADEYATYGLEFPSPGDRVRRLESACRLLKAAWTGRPVTLEDEFHPLAEATFAPGPVQRPHPYLILGVKGDRALRVAVRHADEWNWNRSKSATDAYFERMDAVDRLCEEEGRDPASLARGLGFRRLFGKINAGRETFEDAVETTRRAVRRGAGHIVLMLGEPETAAEEIDFYRHRLIPEVEEG